MDTISKEIAYRKITPINRFINTYDNESYYFYKKYYLAGVKDGIKLKEKIK